MEKIQSQIQEQCLSKVKSRINDLETRTEKNLIDRINKTLAKGDQAIAEIEAAPVNISERGEAVIANAGVEVNEVLLISTLPGYYKRFMSQVVLRVAQYAAQALETLDTELGRLAVLANEGEYRLQDCKRTAGEIIAQLRRQEDQVLSQFSAWTPADVPSPAAKLQKYLESYLLLADRLSERLDLPNLATAKDVTDRIGTFRTDYLTKVKEKVLATLIKVFNEETGTGIKARDVDDFVAQVDAAVKAPRAAVILDWRGVVGSASKKPFTTVKEITAALQTLRDAVNLADQPLRPGLMRLSEDARDTVGKPDALVRPASSSSRIKSGPLTRRLAS